MALIDDMRQGMISVDNLFTTQEERDEAKLKKLYDIPLDQIDEFPGHPYKVRDDEDMMNLMESIEQFGVLTPATVRQKEDGRYEMLSGHRRMRASRLAGLDTIKCEVVDLDRDESIIFMVDSNLQRTTILPSEKARSYKMRYDAMKRQGKRSDITSGPLDPKLKGKRTDEILAEEVSESARQIKRYIRLNELVPEILDLVDQNKIGLRPAVEISYLPVEMQAALVEAMEVEQCTPSHAQAIKMRQLMKEDKLTDEVISYIMQEEKPNQKERLVLHSSKIIEKLPRDLPISKREDFISKAIDCYLKELARQREEKIKGRSEWDMER